MEKAWRRLYLSTRWFALGLGFLIVNSVGVIEWVKHSRGKVAPPGVPGITEFSPGAVTPVEPNEPLHVRFSTDMASEEELGKWRPDGPFLITPEVDGKYLWKTPRHLVFLPVDTWPGCQEFAVRLRDSAKDVMGRRVRAEKLFSFSSDALRCVEIARVDLSVKREATIRLVFNHPVRRENLKEFIQVLSEGGAKVDFTLVGGVESAEVLLQTERIADARLRVRVLKGLEPVGGDLILAKTKEGVLSFGGVLQIRNMRGVLGSERAHRVRFDTSARFLSLPAAEDSISVKPAVDFSLHRRYSGYDLVGDFMAGHSYEVRIKSGISARGGEQLQEDVVRRIYMPEYKPNAVFELPGRYLSTRGTLNIPVNVVNLPELSIAAHKVYANNLVHFVQDDRGGQRFWYAYSAHQGLSRAVGEAVLPIRSDSNVPVNVPIDLGLLIGNEGPGIYLLEAKLPDTYRSASKLVVVTDLGISLNVSEDNLLVWVNGIHDVEAVEDARVLVYCDENQVMYEARTNAEGLALIERNTEKENHAPTVIVVQHGEDISYLDLSDSQVKSMQQTKATRSYHSQGYEAFVYTDRGVYRPGETAHIKIMVRNRDGYPPKEMPVEIDVVRPDGKRFRSDIGLINELGTRCMDIELPHFLPAGDYTIQCRLPGADDYMGSTRIALEDFVPPTIRVRALPAEERTRAGDLIHYGIEAEYLFGAAAAGLQAKAWVDFKSEAFSPPGFESFVFADDEQSFSGKRKELGRIQLDADGRGLFSCSVPKNIKTSAALQATLGVAVMEASGRTVTRYIRRSVDVNSHYIGIERRSGSDFLNVGTHEAFRVTAVTPEGAVADVQRVKWTLEAIHWHRVNRVTRKGAHRYETERVLKRYGGGESVVANGYGSIPVVIDHPGDYLLVVVDEASGVRASRVLRVRGTAGYWSNWNARRPGEITLEADKEEYFPGEQVTLQVRSPFPGRALVTLEQDGVIKAWTRNFAKNTGEITFPVAGDFAPNIYCSVRIIRAVRPGMDSSVYRASGRISIPVVKADQRLQVAVEVPERSTPRSPLTARVQLRDYEGRPVQGELSIAAVDEAICMLTKFETPDPLGFFQASRASGVRGFDLYQLLMPEFEVPRLAGESAPGGGHLYNPSSRLSPVVGNRFRPVSIWQGEIKTDANGFAEVTLDLPEFTGELRLMAVALSEKGFGSMATSVKVARSLVVQPSLPRFMAPDDYARVSLKIFNQSREKRRVQYHIDGEKLAFLAPKSGVISLAPGAQQIIDIQLRASAKPGLAKVKFVAEAGMDSYCETFELPIRPAAPRVIERASGVVKAGESVELDMNADWLDGTGEATLLCSHRPDVELGEPLDALLRYPYGCLEQTTSAAFPLIHLSHLAQHVHPGALNHDDTSEFVQAGIYRVLSMQRVSGSFGYWPRSEEVYPYGSVYATHFLVEAAAAGYQVPEAQLEGSLRALKKQMKANLPTYDQEESDLWHDHMAMRTYSALVLARAGSPDYGVLSRLRELMGEMRLDARVRLVAAFAAAGQRKEALSMIKRIRWYNQLRDSVESGGSLGSGAVELALLIDAWLELDPESDELARLVNRLTTLKQNGQWFNTHGNALSLMALGKYAREALGRPQCYQAEVELASGDVLKIDEKRVQPIRVHGDRVEINNQGPGNLYYTFRNSGVPSNGRVVEVDEGLTVRSVWLDHDGKLLTTNTVAQGELLVGRITVEPEGEGCVDNLAIEHLLPAGLELENASLATSQVVDWLEDEDTLAMRSTDGRDDRLILFPRRVRGRCTYHFAVRAVTRGEWSVPAVLAESMYDGGIRSVSKPMDMLKVVRFEDSSDGRPKAPLHAKERSLEQAL